MRAKSREKNISVLFCAGKREGGERRKGEKEVAVIFLSSVYAVGLQNWDKELQSVCRNCFYHGRLFIIERTQGDGVILSHSIPILGTRVVVEQTKC